MQNPKTLNLLIELETKRKAFELATLMDISVSTLISRLVDKAAKRRAVAR